MSYPVLWLCAEFDNSGQCSEWVEHSSIYQLSMENASILVASIATLWAVAFGFKMLIRFILNQR